MHGKAWGGGGFCADSRQLHNEAAGFQVHCCNCAAWHQLRLNSRLPPASVTSNQVALGTPERRTGCKWFTLGFVRTKGRRY